MHLEINFLRGLKNLLQLGGGVPYLEFLKALLFEVNALITTDDAPDYIAIFMSSTMFRQFSELKLVSVYLQLVI